MRRLRPRGQDMVGSTPFFGMLMATSPASCTCGRRLRLRSQLLSRRSPQGWHASWEPLPSLISLHSRPFAHLFWGQIFAIAMTWLIAGLNIIGTRKSANVQLSLTWLKGALILVIAGFCFGAAGHHGSWHNYATVFTGARGGFSGFMIALVAALWAYDGWSDVVTMAGEVKQPQRSMPLALVGGVTIVGLLYMLTNAAIQYVLPASVIAAADRPAADAMRIVAGQWGATLVSVGMAVSICATFVGSSLSGARVPFAAARDGLVLQAVGACKFTLSNTFDGADPSSSSEFPAAAGHRKISSAVLACHLQRMALLRADSEHDLRLSPSRSRFDTALQHLGLSGAAGAVHPCGGGASGVFVRGSAAKFIDRHGDHPAWYPAVLL